MTEFDAPDAVHLHGSYVIRRAQASDALAHCRADARFVADTYAAIMPPEFVVARLAEADGLARMHRVGQDPGDALRTT